MLKDILKRIQDRLQATNQKAASASVKAGLSKDAIRNIERAVEEGKEGGCSTQTLLKLAPILETTASWLIEGKGSEERQSPEAALRSAMLAFGVDHNQLDRAIKIISTFVRSTEDEERSEQTQSDDQSLPANRRRESAPSK